MTTISPYGFTYCAANEDDSLYLTGVVDELESQDVKHTILWERIGGQWNRYQWGNRSYGVATYLHSGGPAAAYLGYDGNLKVRSRVAGSSVQVLEPGDDTPSTLRSVTCIRPIGGQLFVVGMRRMVYRRDLEAAHWQRYDAGMRLALADTSIAGLRSIDGMAAEQLVAVGLEGEIWFFAAGAWKQDNSPTNIRLAAVRHVGAGQYVIGGADGTLIVGGPGRWQSVAHNFPDETFRCIETCGGRIFIGTESGHVFELNLQPSPALAPFALGSPAAFISWMSSTSSRIYFLGRTSVQSLGTDGWRDESPTPDLLA